MTTSQYKCQCCKELFTARIADRARGWARFCSKSCKAKKQEQRTGQYRHFVNNRDHHENRQSGYCFVGMDEESVQGI